MNSFEDTTSWLLDFAGTLVPAREPVTKLYPYFFTNLPKYLETNWENQGLKNLLRELKLEQSDHATLEDMDPPEWASLSPEAERDSILAYASWRVEEDLESVTLSSLIGRICKEGFESGAIEMKVYPDVMPSLKRWRHGGKVIYSYSSHSRQSQKLALQYSDSGDLTHHVSSYFDLSEGPQDESYSYTQIAEKCGLAPDEILFIGDELRATAAASQAGLQVIQCVRPGRSDLETSNFRMIQSLNEV